MLGISSLNVNLNVRKTDGSIEPFSADKIITSCMNVGASFVQASQISSEIAESAHDGIPTKEIRIKVFEKLKIIDSGMADQYMYRLHMNVKTSKTILESFDTRKIIESLVKETNLDQHYSTIIAREVEKELAKMHLKHVTAPLIREIVNVKLLEHGFESARARYTRLGMPVYDVKQLIEHSNKSLMGKECNPEAIHKLMADQISREYALLNVLPSELADAHMSGKIHIHDLDYYSLRPMGFCHDLRFFLRNGLNPSGRNGFTATSGPAKNPEVAFLHAAKLLAAAQTNCSGGQGLSYFNTYLAPYVHGLDYNHVRQLVQMFIYELSQMQASRGGQMVYSSVDLSLGIPPILSNVPAVGPRGVATNPYSSFEEESLMIFRAMVDVFSQGDFNRNPFRFPKINIHITRESLKHPLFDGVLQLVLSRRSPYLIMSRSYLPEVVSYHSSSCLMPDLKENIGEALLKNYPRGGCMQAVSINLPQMAYDVNGNDDKLFESLDFWVNKARDALLLKLNIIESNLHSGLLSFMAQKVSENERYFEPSKQNLGIGFVGLSEMVKAHTDLSLTEDDGRDFAFRFMERMSSLVKNLSDVSGLKFVLTSIQSNSHSTRMAETDLVNHPKAVVSYYGPQPFYTSSFRPFEDEISVETLIETEGMFSPFMNGGHLTSLDLKDYSLDNLSFNLMRIAGNSEVQYLKFV